MPTKFNSYLDRFVSNKRTAVIMLTCCFGYAVFKTADRVTADIFQTILFLGSLAAFWVNRKLIIKDRVFILLLITIIIPVLSWVNSKIYITENAESTPELGEITNFYFFIFIAYWLKGNVKLVYLFWASFIAGVLLTIFLYSQNITTELALGFEGHRIDFNYVNANHSAALFGAVILGSLFYTIKLTPLRENRTISSWLKFFSSFFLAIVFITLLIFTQSRQVWLAIPTSIIAMIASYITINRKSINWIYIIPIFLLFIFISLALFQIPEINHRLTSELYIIPSILTGNIDNIPYSSMGIRLHLWFEGINQFLSHPLLGLGHNAKELVISLSNHLPQYIKNEFTHLHNGHLEVLTNYGLLGYSTFIALFYLLIKSGKHYKDGDNMTILSVGLITYFFIINMFESFLSFKSGLYLFNCIAAGIYTFQLHHDLNRETE